MKRYKISVLLPQSTEVVVADIQAAHNEATKMVPKDEHGGLLGVVQTIEYIEDVITDPMDFGDDVA